MFPRSCTKWFCLSNIELELRNLERLVFVNAEKVIAKYRERGCALGDLWCTILEDQDTSVKSQLVGSNRGTRLRWPEK